MDGYALEAHFTNVTPLGLSHRGLHLLVAFEGAMTEGPWSGGAVNGTDHLVIRNDGVADIEIHEAVSIDGSVVAALRVLGHVNPPFEMPPPSVLADPGFEWPDVDLPLHGAAFIDVATDDVPGATATVFGCRGTVNVATGTIKVRAWALSATPAPAH